MDYERNLDERARRALAEADKTHIKGWIVREFPLDGEVRCTAYGCEDTVGEQVRSEAILHPDLLLCGMHFEEWHRAKFDWRWVDEKTCILFSRKVKFTLDI